MIFPSAGQSCVWPSLVKASIKRRPLENSMEDNHILEIKAKIKVFEADVSWKCLQGKWFWEISDWRWRMLAWEGWGDAVTAM